MDQDHPGVALLKRFDPSDVAGTADVFAEDVVWHFFNPRLPEMHGDYVGRAQVQAFYEKLAELTRGTFRVNPVSVITAGDELLVVHSRNTMVLGDQPMETDVVVVWRVVDGRFAEVWDIPSVHSGTSSCA